MSVELGPSGHVDTFSRDNLPPFDQWPELLLDGAGDAIPLERVLRINPAVTEGVLHVTAQAASCDDDPAIEYPACHLNQQDWGVPVRVVDGGPTVLTLPLHG